MPARPAAAVHGAVTGGPHAVPRGRWHPCNRDQLSASSTTRCTRFSGRGTMGGEEPVPFQRGGRRGRSASHQAPGLSGRAHAATDAG